MTTTGRKPTQLTGRIVGNEIECKGIEVGSSEDMTSHRKAPEARQTLAQPVRAGKTTRKTPAP